MNEEEKKTIEKFIEKCYKYDESVEIKGISVGEEYRMLNTVCKALNLIEKLQKENEELKDFKKQVIDIESTNFIKYKNYISIQKVKDKIEELNKEIKSCTEIDAIFKIKQQQILQELLESEK